MKSTTIILLAVGLTLSVATACGGKKPPVPNAPPAVAPFPGTGTTGNPTTPPPAPPAPPLVADDPVVTSSSLPWNDQPIDKVNEAGVLKPIYFLYDSDELSDEARKILTANAEVLKTYKTWVITVEGHCDERGTAEYNLALGDRRALVAKNFLASLGIPAERLRTVSYGKEFPFDPGHTEDAWSKNRRAHFMLTSR